MEGEEQQRNEDYGEEIVGEPENQQPQTEVDMGPADAGQSPIPVADDNPEGGELQPEPGEQPGTDPSIHTALH